MKILSQESGRGRFEGVTNIVRFNPRYFLISGSVISVAVTLLILGYHTLPALIGWIAIAGTALALWWFIASLIVSWWIYDRSSLYQWSWLPADLMRRAETVVAAHAGFDEVSGSLASHLTEKQLLAIDFFDPERMTEKSIQRARRICPPLPGTLAVGRARWELPVTPDVVLFILSAHEWRTHAERVEILTSARDSLAEGGTVIVVEHLRDLANFIAFGPGFLHFHSEPTWQKAWSEAGLIQKERFRITPFLGVFVLTLPR